MLQLIEFIPSLPERLLLLYAAMACIEGSSKPTINCLATTRTDLGVATIARGLLAAELVIDASKQVLRANLLSHGVAAAIMAVKTGVLQCTVDEQQLLEEAVRSLDAQCPAASLMLPTIHHLPVTGGVIPQFQSVTRSSSPPAVASVTPEKHCTPEDEIGLSRVV